MVAQKLDTEIRQKQITQAAFKLAASNGLKGLSIASIADEVGLVPSAVYRHFKNKGQVVDAIFELIRVSLLGNVRKVAEETEDLVDQLKRLLMLHIKLIRENRGILRIVFSDDVMNGPPERKARVHSIIQEYLGAVAKMVQQGQKAGVIRTDLEANTASGVFLGLIQPAAILYHLSEGQYDVTSHAERAWEIFLAGIIHQPPGTNQGRNKEVSP